MKNEVISIISKVADGSEVTETSVVVFAEKKSASRAEFYAAYQVGLTTKIVFLVDTIDWELASEVAEPTEIEYNGKRYNVIRTYEKAYETEVTCG